MEGAAISDQTDVLMTIFTPTYNRGDRIHRPFESLMNQDGDVSFEWLVIDDGSTDNTAERIKEFQEKATFPIRYYYKENGGKHRALNMAYTLARGTYFSTLDSDDEFTPNALRDMEKSWNYIPEEERDQFGYIMALVVDEKGQLQGKEFPEEYFESNFLDCRYKLKIHGERIETSRTAVLREFPMPEPPYHMPWFSEGVNWARIGRRYRTLFVNHIWRIYYRNEEDSILHIKDPKQPQKFISLIYTLNEQLDYFPYAPRRFLRHAIGAVRYGFALDEDLRSIRKRLTGFGAKALVTVAVPFYWVIEFKNSRKRDVSR